MKNNKLLIILLALAIVFMVALGLVLFGGKIKTALQGPGNDWRYAVHFSEFTVNLAEDRRYVRFQLHLCFDERALNKEIENRETELKDRIITLIRGKTVHELAEPGGMDQLRDELMHTLNEVLTAGQIKKVLFPEFFIQ